MKNIILSLMVAFAFIGCSSSSQENKNVEPKLVVGKSLESLKLNDQNEKPETIKADTKVIFFSFSKPVGHMCNAFLEKQSDTYLPQHHAIYVADVSPAPSIIKSMFILPDLKKLKFPILLINDDNLSAQYTKGMDKESIVVVTVENGTIKKIDNLKDTKALEAMINK
jgi:hypothetical protein